MALLWPDQGRLIRALEPRLAQLIQRLRNTHRFVIHVVRETLSLSDAGVARVFVDLESKTPLAPALEIPETLTPAWMASTYGLGLTQARKCLQQWEERGWVRTEGAGSRKTYRLTFSLITI